MSQLLQQILQEVTSIHTRIDSLESRITSIEGNMATKTDLTNFATKADLSNMATKADFANFATKDDLKELKSQMVTKDEFNTKFQDLEARQNARIDAYAKEMRYGYQQLSKKIELIFHAFDGPLAKVRKQNQFMAKHLNITFPDDL